MVRKNSDKNALVQAMRSRDGNMALMFAFLFPALLLAGGSVVDYNRAVGMRDDLQSAADSASLALAAGQLLGDHLPDDKASAFVNANVAGQTGFTVVSVAAEQPEPGAAKVTVTGAQDNTFLRFLGMATTSITVVSETRYENPPDIDFTVFVDRSPSMLIGATPADIATIETINQDMGEGASCGFACHYDGRDSYTVTRTQGGATRLDAAKASVQRLFTDTLASPFSDHADAYGDISTFTNQLHHEGEGLIEGLGPTVAAIEPDGSGDISGDQYAQTDYRSPLQDMAARVAAKAGSHPDRERYAILVTDGVADYRNGPRIIEPFDPSLCDAVKEDAVLAVIYTTYFPLPGNNFYNNNVAPFQEQIGPNLQTCASQSWFFEAQHADDIDAAMEQILAKALPLPRLVQ
ncbi:MAG: TadE/TadG family type IV pilus assembly protein [Pseudomonadota bacterium]